MTLVELIEIAPVLSNPPTPILFVVDDPKVVTSSKFCVSVYPVIKLPVTLSIDDNLLF